MRTYRRWALVGRPTDPPTYARKVLVNHHRSLLLPPRQRTVVVLRYYEDSPSPSSPGCCACRSAP
jgi:hypothetical protein